MTLAAIHRSDRNAEAVTSTICDPRRGKAAAVFWRKGTMAKASAIRDFVANGIPPANSSAPAAEAKGVNPPSDKAADTPSQPLTFSAVDPSKKPPIDLNLPPKFKYSTLPQGDPTPVPPAVPTPAPGNSGDYAPPQPEPFHKDPVVGPGMPVDPHQTTGHTPDLPLDKDALLKRLKDPLGTSQPASKPVKDPSDSWFLPKPANPDTKPCPVTPADRGASPAPSPDPTAPTDPKP